MEEPFLISQSNILSFMFAGNALFTIKNVLTGNRFTFKIEKHKTEDIFFASFLSGSNNECDYTFIGTIFDKKTYRHGKKSTVSVTVQSVRSFVWFFEKVKTNSLPECIKVYHEGRCCRCGRTLTTPESIEKGIGPECAKKG